MENSAIEIFNHDMYGEQARERSRPVSCKPPGFASPPREIEVGQETWQKLAIHTGACVRENKIFS